MRPRNFCAEALDLGLFPILYSLSKVQNLGICLEYEHKAENVAKRNSSSSTENRGPGRRIEAAFAKIIRNIIAIINQSLKMILERLNLN